MRAEVVKKIFERDAENHECIKMPVSCDDNRIAELIVHNKFCDSVAEKHDWEASGEDKIFVFH